MSNIPNEIFMQVRYNGDQIELDTHSFDNIHIDDIAYLRRGAVAPLLKDAYKALRMPWDKRGAIEQSRVADYLEILLKDIGEIK